MFRFYIGLILGLVFGAGFGLFLGAVIHSTRDKLMMSNRMD